MCYNVLEKAGLSNAHLINADDNNNLWYYHVIYRVAKDLVTRSMRYGKNTAVHAFDIDTWRISRTV